MTGSKSKSWKTGFSKLVNNWRVSNSSEPFSAAAYRRIDDINRTQNRAVMEKVFERIERSCRSGARD